MELLDIGKVFLGIDCNALYLWVMQIDPDKAGHIELQYKKQAV